MKYNVSLRMLGDTEVAADTPNKAKAKVLVALELGRFFELGGLAVFIDDVEITGIFDVGWEEIDENQSP